MPGLKPCSGGKPPLHPASRTRTRPYPYETVAQPIKTRQNEPNDASLSEPPDQIDSGWAGWKLWIPLWGLVTVAVLFYAGAKGAREGLAQDQQLLSSYTSVLSSGSLPCLRDSQIRYFTDRPCMFHRHSFTLEAAVREVLPWLERPGVTGPLGCVVMAVAVPSSEWLEQMKAAGLFRKCRVFFYPAEEHFYSSAIDLLSGLDNSYVKHWDPQSSLDNEVATLSQLLPRGWPMLTLITGTPPDVVLKGYVEALLMNQVAGVLWERDGAMGHSRSAVHEVDFFHGFGMVVYLIGAEPAAYSEEDHAQLGPLLRLDSSLFFRDYEPSDPAMTLTFIAVQSGSLLQRHLDGFLLCADASSGSGQTCQCLLATQKCDIVRK